jgi:hypothetical protein
LERGRRPQVAGGEDKVYLSSYDAIALASLTDVVDNINGL